MEKMFYEVDATFKIDNMVPGTVYVLDTAFNEYADHSFFEFDNGNYIYTNDSCDYDEPCVICEKDIQKLLDGRRKDIYEAYGYEIGGKIETIMDLYYLFIAPEYY